MLTGDDDGLPNGDEFPRRPDNDRRQRQAARLARLLRVHELIQSGQPWTPEAIAEQLNCSPRTVQRDLEVLNLAKMFPDEGEN